MTIQKKWMMYVVECSDGTLYTGITTDIKRRILEHNFSMRGAKYTKSRRPVKLKFSMSALTHSDAAKKEARFKKLTKTEKVRIINAQSW